MKLKKFKHIFLFDGNEYLWYAYDIVSLYINGDIVYCLLGYSHELHLSKEFLKSFRTEEEAFAYVDALPEVEVAM